jgi:hypothetical protein
MDDVGGEWNYVVNAEKSIPKAEFIHLSVSRTSKFFCGPETERTWREKPAQKAKSTYRPTSNILHLAGQKTREQ